MCMSGGVAARRKVVSHRWPRSDHWRLATSTAETVYRPPDRRGYMGERACYREFCPDCDAPVSVADEECPDCGAFLDDIQTA